MKEKINVLGCSGHRRYLTFRELEFHLGRKKYHEAGRKKWSSHLSSPNEELFHQGGPLETKLLFSLEGWTEAIIPTQKTTWAFTFYAQPAHAFPQMLSIEGDTKYILIKWTIFPGIPEWNRSAQPLSTCIHLEKIHLQLLTKKDRIWG